MNVLEDKQRRNFKQLSMSPGIWDYVSNNKVKSIICMATQRQYILTIKKIKIEFRTHFNIE
jgi:hypothetical protein